MEMGHVLCSIVGIDISNIWNSEKMSRILLINLVQLKLDMKKCRPACTTNSTISKYLND